MRRLICCAALSASCIGMTTVPAPPLDGAKAELLTIVEQIRQAQIELQVVDDYLPCGDADTAKASFSIAPRDWDGPDCFVRIGFAPETSVRGGYWVEVAADKSDFTVHGLADIDGDGTYQEVVASKGAEAKVITPDTVF